MKKAVFLALLVSVILSLSVTASYADPGCAPGCDCTSTTGSGATVNNKGIWGLLGRHSDAVRVKDRATERQIIKRNDSTLALTCFDQAMRITSRLGKIFSDNVPVPPAIANTQVFKTTVGYVSDWGVTKLLALDLNKLVTPVLNFMLLNNFVDSLFGNLTAMALDAMMGILSPILTSVQGAITSVTGTITTITGYLNDINYWIGQLGIVPPLSITAIITTLNSIKTLLDGAIASLLSTLTGLITGLINQIRDYVLGLIPLPGIGMTDALCNRMETLWNDPTGGVLSVKGQSIQSGAPYTDLRNFVNRLPGTIPGGDYFMQEIGLGPLPPAISNNAILNAAMDDLITLALPGGVPSWPTTPIFPAASKAIDIINAM